MIYQKNSLKVILYSKVDVKAISSPGGSCQQ